MIARKALPKGIQGTARDLIGAAGGQFPIHFGGSLLNEDELVAQGIKKEVDVGAAAIPQGEVKHCSTVFPTCLF